MNDSATSTTTASPFWPVFLTALSLAGLLGWQTVEACRQRAALNRLAIEQQVLVGQAAQTEAKLQALMLELMNLARTDADARAIVTKYRITFNPPVSTLPSAGVPPAAAAPAPR